MLTFRKTVSHRSKDQATEVESLKAHHPLTKRPVQDEFPLPLAIATSSCALLSLYVGTTDDCSVSLGAIMHCVVVGGGPSAAAVQHVTAFSFNFPTNSRLNIV